MLPVNLELKANPDRDEGAVVEAKVDVCAVVASLLITRGTLKVGDVLLVPKRRGRCADLEAGQVAGDGDPVEVCLTARRWRVICSTSLKRIPAREVAECRGILRPKKLRPVPVVPSWTDAFGDCRW